MRYFYFKLWYMILKDCPLQKNMSKCKMTGADLLKAIGNHEKYKGMSDYSIKKSLGKDGKPALVSDLQKEYNKLTKSTKSKTTTKPKTVKAKTKVVDCSQEKTLIKELQTYITDLELYTYELQDVIEILETSQTKKLKIDKPMSPIKRPHSPVKKALSPKSKYLKPMGTQTKDELDVYRQVARMQSSSTKTPKSSRPSTPQNKYLKPIKSPMKRDIAVYKK